MTPNKADLRRYLIERDDEALKKMIREARAAGMLKEVSSALLTAVLEAPEFVPNVNQLLDDLFTSPNPSPRPAQPQPQQATEDEPQSPSPTRSGSLPLLPDDANLSMQRTLEWARRELVQIEDSDDAVRRTELLQLCSVIKYVSGNRLGLYELREYEGGLRPLASTMMMLYHTTPENAPTEERRLVQGLLGSPE